MFLAVAIIVAFLAGLGFGRWLYPSEATVTRRREEKQRELERPEHDFDRARQIAEAKSELSRVRNWPAAS